MESSNTVLALDFDLIDDVLHLPQSSAIDIIRGAELKRLGPLVEFAYGDYEHLIVRAAQLFPSEPATSLIRSSQFTGLSNYTGLRDLRPRNFEFIPSPSLQDEFRNPSWTTFCKRAELAAVMAGVGKGLAAGMVGIMIEMTSNVVEHSEAAATSIVGYRSICGSFEFVVADSGTGIMNSLRTNREFQNVRDSGMALELAIREGVSRFGGISGRGMGFRNLLKNIANRRSILRFRSGDHSLTIDGTGDGIVKILKQCADFSGSLVNFVTFSS